MPSLLQVFTTLGSAEDATEIGRTLVNEHLAACAQVIPGLTSIYMWEEMLRHDNEALLILKTTEEAWPLLRDRIAELHPYDTPEVVAIPATHTTYDYQAWVHENTK